MDKKVGKFIVLGVLIFIALMPAVFSAQVSWRPTKSYEQSQPASEITSRINVSDSTGTKSDCGFKLHCPGTNTKDYFTVYRWNNSGIDGQVSNITVFFEVDLVHDCVDADVVYSTDSAFGYEKTQAVTCNFDDIDTNYFGGASSGTLNCTIPITEGMEANFMDIRMNTSDCDGGGPDYFYIDYVYADVEYTPDSAPTNVSQIYEYANYFLINNSHENYYINKSDDVIIIDNYAGYWGQLHVCWGTTLFSEKCSLDKSWTYEYYGNGTDAVVLRSTAGDPIESMIATIEYNLNNTSTRMLVKTALESISETAGDPGTSKIKVNASAIKVNNTANDDVFWIQNVSTLDDWEIHPLNNTSLKQDYSDAESTLFNQHYVLKDDVTRKKIRFWWETNYTQNDSITQNTNTTLNVTGALYPNASVFTTVPTGYLSQLGKVSTNFYWVDPIIKDLENQSMHKPTINPWDTDVTEGRYFDMTCDPGFAGSGKNPKVTGYWKYCIGEDCTPDTNIPTDNSGPLKDTSGNNPDNNANESSTHKVKGLAPGEYRVRCRSHDKNNGIYKNGKTINITILEPRNITTFGSDLNHSGWSVSFAPDYSKYSSAGLTEEITLDPGEFMESTPLVTTEGIFMQTDKKLYAYDHLGNSLWNSSLQGPQTSYNTPAIASGMVCHSDVYQVYCRNLDTGNLVWNYSETGVKFSSSSPVINNNKLWIGSGPANTPYLYAFNLSTGAVISKLAYPETVSPHQKSIFTPAITDGVVYVQTLDDNAQRGLVLAVDESDGTNILWNYTILNGSSQHNTPAIHNNRLFVCVQNNVQNDGKVSHVLAINRTDGSLLWRFNITNDDVTEWQKWSDRVIPVVYAGKVIVSATDWNTVDTTVYAINETIGEQLWNYTITGEDIWASPTVADSKIILGTGGSKVYALHTENGTKIWEYSTGSGVYSSPAIVDDTIFIGDDNSKVYKLKANTTHSNSSVDFTNGVLTTVDATDKADTILEIMANNNGNAIVHVRKYIKAPGAVDKTFGETQLNKYIKVEHNDVNDKMEWAIVKLYYTDDEILALDLNESTLKLYVWNGTEWECGQCGVNETGNYVWKNTTHFSIFGSGGKILDLDGDGFVPPTDCNNLNPGINPGAEDICNLIDDNCNGQVDENLVCELITDTPYIFSPPETSAPPPAPGEEEETPEETAPTTPTAPSPITGGETAPAEEGESIDDTGLLGPTGLATLVNTTNASIVGVLLIAGLFAFHIAQRRSVKPNRRKL